MILIFDTYSGLCNQMFDIQCAINFCIIHKIKFTFRHSSLRNLNNLSLWYDVSFNNLFDDTFIKDNSLYIQYNSLNCNSQNTYNFNENKRAIEILTPNDIITQLQQFDKQYIVLKQFWSIHLFKQIQKNIYNELRPCNRLMQYYNNIKTSYLPEKYNFIHYRYESDFVNHFKLKHLHKLCKLIENIPFKDKSLKVYIAASNLLHLSEPYISRPITAFSNILYKDGKQGYSDNLNFEENAFIDFMIGRNAVEVYGHNQSSFSTILNSLHNTNNYYNV